MVPFVLGPRTHEQKSLSERDGLKPAASEDESWQFPILIIGLQLYDFWMLPPIKPVSNSQILLTSKIVKMCYNVN